MTVELTTRIAWDDTGAGGPIALCLPGWCGDRSVFAPLVPRLARVHRVITVDLPGQGDSPPAGDFDSADVVDSLVAVIDEAGAGPVIPIALSHAGWFAIELRRRLGPQRVPGIVLLDWMVLGTPPGFGEALDGLQDPAAWEQVRGALFGMWTTGVDLPALHSYVAGMGSYGYQHWSRAGREISAGFAAHGAPLDALAALDPPCPTLHLYAQPDDPALLAAQLAVAEARAWFQVRKLDARSHFPMFEVPDVLAAQVGSFVSGLR